MKEFDLNDIWKKGDQKSESFFDGIEPELESLVQQRSSDLITKIKRNIWLEIIASALFLPIIFLVDNNTPKLEFIIVFFLVISVVILFPYVSFFRNLKQIQTKDVLNNLKAKRDILQLFMLRLKVLFRIFFPISFIVGLYIGFGKGKGAEVSILDPTFLLIAGIFLIGLPIYDWLVNKAYYYHLYGKHIEEYEEIIKNLEQEK